MDNQENNEEQPWQEEKVHNESHGNNEGVVNNNDLFTLIFPIGHIPARGLAPMKYILLSSLPNFHGLTTKDLDEFLF